MTNMTEARVLELIEAYGPEPAAWPEQEREPASAMLRARPSVFSEALAEARALDAALLALPEPQAPAGLAERIIASAPVAKTARAAGILDAVRDKLSIGGKLWPSATAMASAVFGMFIGYSALGATQVASVDYADEAVYAAFDEGYDFDQGDFSL